MQALGCISYNNLPVDSFIKIMTLRQRYLLGIASLTLLFMALILAGSYLLSIESKQYAVACFLFAFGAVFGQIACLALFLRQHARSKFIAAQKTAETTPISKE